MAPWQHVRRKVSGFTLPSQKWVPPIVVTFQIWPFSTEPWFAGERVHFPFLPLKKKKTGVQSNHHFLVRLELPNYHYFSGWLSWSQKEKCCFKIPMRSLPQLGAISVRPLRSSLTNLGSSNGWFPPGHPGKSNKLPRWWWWRCFFPGIIKKLPWKSCWKISNFDFFQIIQEGLPFMGCHKPYNKTVGFNPQKPT